MNFKDDLKVVINPKNFSLLAQTTDFKSGLKLMGIWGLFLLIVNVVVSFLNGLIGGKLLGKIFGFSLFTSIGSILLMIVSLLVMAVIGGYCSKLFKVPGDIQKSIAGLSYGMVIMFVLGAVQNLILFIDTVGVNFSPDAFKWIYGILMVVSLVWMAWLGMEAMSWANLVKKWQGLVCFLAGFIIMGIINLFLIGVFVAVLTSLFRGIGVF